MPDLLDDEFAVAPQDKTPRRVARKEKRAAQRLARATKKLEQQERIRSTIKNPPPTRGLLIAALLFVAVIVVGALAPNWFSTPSKPPATSTPTASSAPVALTAEQTAREWATAYFNGGAWEKLTLGSSVDALTTTRNTVYFGSGSPLRPDQKVQDVTVLPSSTAGGGTTWTRTLNVAFTGGNPTVPIAAAFDLTLVDDGKTGWKVSAITPTFLGET